MILTLLPISSAIVNTPPPFGPVALNNQFASHKHRTLHRECQIRISLRQICESHLASQSTRPLYRRGPGTLFGIFSIPLLVKLNPLLLFQLPLFEIDTDGSSRTRMQYVMDKRNYALFNFDHGTHDLNIDVMVEIKQGEGKTKA